MGKVGMYGTQVFSARGGGCGCVGGWGEVTSSDSKRS